MVEKSEGLAGVESRHSVDETVWRLQQLLEENGIKVSALVDHSGEAQKAGLEMHPTKLLIFGSPKGGTPLMQVAPTTAIDLPLKALVWQDDDRKVRITYNTAEYLRARHGFPADLMKNIGPVAMLLQKAAE